ncbi:cytochrome P450 monooxygenase [Teratosphaeria nubilosa]|uniref:Cytochrome P450 monooxygenase n=1 Tax=Teratosphaeria nubilosa TaxID=161662 RepID=A0A6G1L665_9PEZI|nr:cytochrome P450 monooxygenase [Teratosphaeria nubilosa]
MATIDHTMASKPILLVALVVGLLYFGPLSKIPGPRVTALSRLPYVRHLLAGTTVDMVVDLHKKYGEVVRISPNEVSFTSGETAWQDIYGFRTGKMKGHATMQKDPAWYPPAINGAPSILIANDEDHSRGRRLLSHAFSEKALAEQEVLLQNYADQLVDRLREVTTAAPNNPVDMVQWFNWTTFDVIADLMFGEPFGCLQSKRTHAYIQLLFKSVKAFRLGYVVKYFPWVKWFGNLFIDQDMIKERVNYLKWVASQCDRRIERETQRPDFMTQILKHNGGEEKEVLSRPEIHSNAVLFLTAGSETTATLLSGVTYALLKSPSKLHKLQDELRSKFATYSDINLDGVNNSPYLIAVLNEGLRFYPPVPVGFERRVCQQGGEIVSGYYIPEGTAVSVSQYPTYHDETKFKDASEFVPERWMGDKRYENDHWAALQPFGYGPRNCLGKNLAYAEMRLILAKLIWTFDLEMDPSSENWVQRGRVFTLWEKPELAVRLKEVQRA